jgi:uncharacterized membrane protein YqjE
MENRTPASSGLLDALRKLGDSLIGTVHDRIELLSVEVQEEKFRLIRLFVAISAAIFAGIMAVTFASITVVYLFWESARIPVLVGLTLAYSGALAWILISLRNYLSRQPKPFAGTIQELKEDRECFRTEP